MQLSWTSRSHPGCLRQNNEDYVACMGDQGLWLLADGMGGHQAGEVAAQLACQIVSQSIRTGSEPKEAFSLAHQLILDQSEGQQSGMGSTLICLQQLSDEQFQISWVGDSRAYRWRNGELEQLSRDHSYVQSLIDAGQITAEQAREHPEKNIITQCLGAIEYDAIEVESLNSFWLPGDLIILCSDGLNDELHDKEIARILSLSDEPEQQLLDLEEAALESGGKDNISMVGISYGEPKTQRTRPLSRSKRSNKSEIPDSLDFENASGQSSVSVLAFILLIVFLILASAFWFW
ncbi:PP2C family protein-serine/threonine phosphatase [Pseudoteredinibacter isoporae]|uniref:Protein phosphatase n=1 Tax=Pseudoteredinibacter isoporae TaxID=570281 RepID=A0A7X0MVN2_9GAMM|nr:protein phosphatase 2C domain-containing protein [Pseudoteredinibacter isoporae]MBB6521583.1 protein phosphatase [Pseudoteredinibacter isoporae]NHO87137.1 serine/threonine-protein phosphatase [Pseudoteredinibacter isoporae]NIB22961.1 serine/threonine-protein phosphatase [Pseudoteredinibacter isoporae]